MSPHVERLCLFKVEKKQRVSLNFSLKKGIPRPWGPALEEGQGLSPYLYRPSSAAHTVDGLKNSKSPAQLLWFKKPVANNLSIIAWFRYPGTHQCLLF